MKDATHLVVRFGEPVQRRLRQADPAAHARAPAALRALAQPVIECAHADGQRSLALAYYALVRFGPDGGRRTLWSARDPGRSCLPCGGQCTVCVHPVGCGAAPPAVKMHRAARQRPMPGGEGFLSLYRRGVPLDSLHEVHAGTPEGCLCLQMLFVDCADLVAASPRGAEIGGAV